MRQNPKEAPRAERTGGGGLGSQAIYTSVLMLERFRRSPKKSHDAIYHFEPHAFPYILLGSSDRATRPVSRRSWDRVRLPIGSLTLLSHDVVH